MDIEEHYRWRGNIDARMQVAEEKIEAQEEKSAEIDKSVSQILSKLAVPLFFMSIVGVVIGGIVMALVGKLLTK